MPCGFPPICAPQGHGGERLVSGPRPWAGPANMRRGTAQKGAVIFTLTGAYCYPWPRHTGPPDIAPGRAARFIDCGELSAGLVCWPLERGRVSGSPCVRLRRRGSWFVRCLQSPMHMGGLFTDSAHPLAGVVASGRSYLRSRCRSLEPRPWPGSLLVVLLGFACDFQRATESSP